MRKWIALLLTLLMCLSLCACGSSESKPEPEEEASYPVIALTQYTNILGTYELDDYELNDAGQIIAYKKYEIKSGKRTASPVSVSVSYDDAGNPVKVRYESNYGYEELVRTFDDNGLVVRETWSSDYTFNDGKDFVYTYEFDSEGRVSKETGTNANTGDYTVRTYTYDANGTVQSYAEKTYNPDDSLYSDWTIEMECDENGNIVKQNIVDNEDANGGWENTLVYDEIGTGAQKQPPCSGFHYIYPEWL